MPACLAASEKVTVPVCWRAGLKPAMAHAITKMSMSLPDGIIPFLDSPCTYTNPFQTLVEFPLERFDQRKIDVLQVDGVMPSAGFSVSKMLVFLGEIPRDQETVRDIPGQ